MYINIDKPENVSHFDIAPRATVDFGDDEEGVDNEVRYFFKYS
jgi:hypothetical protein